MLSNLKTSYEYEIVQGVESIEIPQYRQDAGIKSGKKNQIRKLQLRIKIGTAPNRGGACATGFSISTEEIVKEGNCA